MKHTNAIGTERYDQSYGLGYRKGHGDFSPFPRVNRMRKAFLDTPFNIDIQRAKIVTDVYRKLEGSPQFALSMYSMQELMNKLDIHIYPDELIVGTIGAPAKAAPIYPEFSVEWIIDELENHPFDQRPHDQFYIKEEDQKELLEILQYWRGKTVSAEVNRNISEEQEKGSELGKKVFLTSLYHDAGIGHFIMDYGHLMEVGLNGLLGELHAGYASFDLDAPGNEERYQYFMAALFEIQAVQNFIYRHHKLAAELASRETDPVRRVELRMIEDNLKQITHEAPQTFWQALQLWYLVTCAVQIESNGHSISFGRMDQWLWPFLKKDLDEGTITKEFAQELLECAYIKAGNPSKLKNRLSSKFRNGRGWGGESLTVGGVDQDGNDATNDLTFMLLEASVHTRMMVPWLCVRMHEDTPYELKVKVAECIRAGYGHPKVYNDRTAIEVMMKKGMSLEEARDYAVVGCVEPDLPGREYGFHDASYMNLMKVLELALNGGRCIDCSRSCPRYAKCAGAGLSLGPDTGSLETASSMEEVLASVDAQIAYWTEQMCSMIDVIDDAHRAYKPTPFASVFFRHCLATCTDLSAGGAEYNFTGPQASGIASCADSLSAVSQLVFEEKKYTGKELMDAVRDNWKGHEVLYRLINGTKVHHFGNDDDAADRFYAFIFNSYCDHVSGRPNARGGFFCPGVYTVNANVSLGADIGASLDGRKAGEPLSDNMGPVHTSVASHDVNGPTAIANSVNKVDHTKATNGTLLNWKFPPECVAGEQGRENLISFIDSFFQGSATHCQFNIMSSDMMRAAMENPEEYRDMLVRVAGYSAYFVELGKPLQMDLINRTELSF